MSAIRLTVALAALLFCFASSFGVRAEEYVTDDALYAMEVPVGQALILITIEDKNQRPLEGVVISVRQGKFGKVFSKVSDKAGQIPLFVPINNTYNITFLSLDTNAEPHVEKFEIADRKEQRHVLIMTYEEPTTKVFILEGVAFATGKATLTSGSFAKLAPLVEYLKMKPDINIELSGHTDNVGDDDANLALSDARAKSVKEYLVSQGIAADRINAVGFGEERPIDTNDTEAGRKKNRRTEVRILD